MCLGRKQFAKVLKEADMKVMSNSDCNQEYPEITSGGQKWWFHGRVQRLVERIRHGYDNHHHKWVTLSDHGSVRCSILMGSNLEIRCWPVIGQWEFGN